MSVLALDFYGPDGDTLIGTLDDAELLAVELRPALMELGAISFTISRHDASAALLRKRNLIKVRIPSIDPDPICLFVIKDDEAVLVSHDEEGGEHLTFTGPGGLHLLSYARLDEVFYAPGQPRRGNQEIPGEWAWHDVAYGSILARLFEEGVYSPGSPLGALTADFTRDVDSDGNPWYVIAEDFSVPTGSDVLTVANQIAKAGDLFLILTPDMVLHCYQSVGDFGRDLSGAFAADNVRIQKGVNLLTELNRSTQVDRITHLITRDMDKVFRTYVTPESFDQAVYGFLDIDWTNDPDQVEKTANETIRSSDFYQEEFRVEVTPGFDPVEGLIMPGPEGTDGHFWLGDTITLDTGSADSHDLNAADVLVTGIVIVLDEAADDQDEDHAARSLRIVPELSYGMPPPLFAGPGMARAIPRLAVPTVSGDSTGLGGGYGSNTATQGITPPAGANAVLIAVITASSEAVPTLTWDGVAPLEVPGSLVTHTTVIPGRADFTQIRWYVAANVTPGVMQTLLFNQSEYIGHLFVSGFSTAVDAGEAMGVSAAPAGAHSGSGSLPVVALGAWAIPGTDGADPTMAAPGLLAWSKNLPTGLGVMDFAIGYGDPTPSFTLAGSTPWVLSLIWINGSATGGSGPPAVVGTSPDAARADHNHKVETLLTDETDTSLVLVPDGSGGVEWGASSSVQYASDLLTRYEPHVDYLGTVVLDGNGDPVMVEVAN